MVSSYFSNSFLVLLFDGVFKVFLCIITCHLQISLTSFPFYTFFFFLNQIALTKNSLQSSEDKRKCHVWILMRNAFPFTTIILATPWTYLAFITLWSFYFQFSILQLKFNIIKLNHDKGFSF